jgi:release factor glutamine methyltransferase
VAVSLAENLGRKSSRRTEIIEIGTGCGNIAVALADLSGDTRIRASDISNEAVHIAKNNVRRYGLESKVAVECGDMFEPYRNSGLEGNIDLVVCNPPYIPTASLKKLGKAITDHEPVLALDAGSYGIDIFRRLIADSAVFLKPGGYLVFEIGAGQHLLAERLITRRSEYQDIRFYDYGGDLRVISAVRAE